MFLPSSLSVRKTKKCQNLSQCLLVIRTSDQNDAKSIAKIIEQNVAQNTIPQTASSQNQSYVLDISAKRNMSECKPTSTPAVPGTKQSKKPCPENGSCETPKMTRLNKPYRSLVGNLMYLLVVILPDTCFAVYYLAQFVSKQGKEHWVAL